uniref:Lipase maturation factor n=1 Tax=Clastoptera arizonana TaxID=38151 RepID=A0A1B6DGU2_9HEMI
MVEIRYTRNLFLRCVNVIYLFAFASLYVQIPGLYGKNGILPAHKQLETKENNLVRNIHNKPTLLWFAPYIGLDTEYMMDVLALTGMFLAFTGFISQKFCSKPIFAAIWSLYYSLFQVGQTFMWFQWDILLLEAGFLCVLLSPLRYKPGTKRRPSPAAPSDHVTFWLVRWLIFRLMFSSGIVKLTSGCPSWWGLTALNVHFESMCIPTPLAWYCHHMPAWFLQINTVFAEVAEIFLPPLFLFPLQSVRTVNFYIQVFLQVNIILTGNFNFFNFLTITLLLSLLEDSFFYKNLKNKTGGKVAKYLSYLVCMFVYGIVIYATYVLFTIRINPAGTLDSKIAFTTKEFDSALGKALPILVLIGLVSFVFTALQALLSSLIQVSTNFNRLLTFLTTTLYIGISAFVFADSLVPFSTLHPSGNTTVLPVVREWHNKVSNLHLTNSYGLFRRMTGVNGRPEVIIEGADDLKGPWMDYNFLYKPGNVNNSLPFVAPHQPRLDWQLWFAALGTYHQNPWIMSLAYRLLTNQPEVLALLDKNNPFANKAPKYVRASLYTYRYSAWSERSSNKWWVREKVGEYFPVFAKDHSPLLEYLKNHNILSTISAKNTVYPYFKIILDQLRLLFTSLEAGLLLWSLFTAGCVIITLQDVSTLQRSTPKPSTPKNKGFGDDHGSGD